MARLTIVEFREELRVRGFDGFASTDLDRYINFSYFDLARRARWTWEKTEDSFTLENGEYWHDLSSVLRFKNLDTITVEAPGEVRGKLWPVSDEEWKEEWLPHDDAGQMPLGSPQKYYITRNRLFILPAPEQNSHSFTVQYWQYMQELTAQNATPITPEDLDEIILLGAEVRCHRRGRQLVFANEAQAEWNRMVDNLLSEETLMVDEELERAVPDVR
jgi:hypothetical protein